MSNVWIGWDPREAAAFAVARDSLCRRATQPLNVRGLVLDDLIAKGLYRRQRVLRGGQWWDVPSEAPISTEHANARFLVPLMAPKGWALFMDGDVLVRGNICRIFERLDPSKAVYCVKHVNAQEAGVKMDGQVQTVYARKNWSSVCLFNVGHPANERLTLDMVNTFPGRELHRFCWLEDHEIGALDPTWNHLVGISPPMLDPQIVHFTLGTPDMPGWEYQDYADEWRAELLRWAA